MRRNLFSTAAFCLAAWALPAAAQLSDNTLKLGVATDLLVTGRTVGAQEALDLGLVNEVADDVVGRALEWARDVADNCAPSAVAVIKRQLLAVDGQDLTAAVDQSLMEMRSAFARDDLTEAVSAKLAKRPAAFGPRTT